MSEVECLVHEFMLLFANSLAMEVHVIGLSLALIHDWVSLERCFMVEHGYQSQLLHLPFQLFLCYLSFLCTVVKPKVKKTVLRVTLSL